MRLRNLWLLVRRPLWLLFACGCVVSIWTSGRFSARLIADGMVSFAFLPVFQILSFAVVYRRTSRERPFAAAADRFFAGDRVWLIWLLGFAALRVLLTPVQAGAPPFLLWRAIQISIALVLVWSFNVDREFFRASLSRPRHAVRDLILQRAVSWGCSLVYFFGIAVWPMIAGRLD